MISIVFEYPIGSFEHIFMEFSLYKFSRYWIRNRYILLCTNILIVKRNEKSCVNSLNLLVRYVIIIDLHAMTCCPRRFLANLVAVFGEYDITGEVESKRSISKNVKRVIVHRQYDAATFENDIALLELETPINYDTHIVPICMPDDDDDFTGRMAVVTGWGRLKYGKCTLIYYIATFSYEIMYITCLYDFNYGVFAFNLWFNLFD